MTSVSETIRQRIVALLSAPERTGAVEGTPNPSAEELGAVGALAYQWPGEAALVNVYGFSDYDLLLAAENTLRNSAQGQTIQLTSNGGLLLWATAPQGDAAAEARIKYMASDFAGRE